MIAYQDMTQEDMDTIRDLIRMLCKNSGIMRTKIDPRTGTDRENPAYEKCQKYAEEVDAAASFFGYQLAFDQMHEIYYLRGENMLSGSLDKDVTRVLLLLALIYAEKNETQLGNGHITTSWQEIRIKGSDTGLIAEKIMAGKFFREICRLLKTNSVIVYDGSADQLHDASTLYITDMIRVLVPSDKINALAEEGAAHAAA